MSPTAGRPRNSGARDGTMRIRAPISLELFSVQGEPSPPLPARTRERRGPGRRLDLSKPERAAGVLQECGIGVGDELRLKPPKIIVEKYDLESVVIHQERTHPVDLVP